MTNTSPSTQARFCALTRSHVILFLVGVALSIAQFVMIRDFVTVLYGEEVVIVLVTAAFFAGLSVGYMLSLRLSKRVFEYLFIISLLLHLTFPFSYRYLAAWFATLDLGGFAYLALLFIYALLFTAVFATFLPRLVSLESDDKTQETRLKVYYSIEILGFVFGFFIVALSWNRSLIYLLPVYWLILAGLLQLVVQRRALTVAYLVAGLAAVSVLHKTDYHSTALLYEHKHYKKQPTILYSVNSPYQKVEVIEDSRGTRYLYLDGLQNLNSSDLATLNYYIATLPAALIRPEHTLLIGNGTLSSVPKVVPYSQRVTSVELDPSVLAAGRRFFVSPARLKGLSRWRLYVDDGKHFLLKSKERYDLIIMDVPSPLTIQEAYLHTAEFYRLARSRLNETGVISVQLSGPLQRNNRTPAQVVAALKAVFPQVMAIYSDKAERGFAYASVKLPFTAADLHRQSRSYEKRITVIHPDSVARYLDRATALSVDHMNLVLRRGLERFMDRYFDD